MAYSQLSQALALAKTKPNTIALEIPRPPQLRGKLAAIDPDGVAVFNEEQRLWLERMVTQLANLSGPNDLTTLTIDGGTP